MFKWVKNKMLRANRIEGSFCLGCCQETSSPLKEDHLPNSKQCGCGFRLEFSPSPCEETSFPRAWSDQNSHTESSTRFTHCICNSKSTRSVTLQTPPRLHNTPCTPSTQHGTVKRRAPTASANLWAQLESKLLQGLLELGHRENLDRC